MKKLFCLLLLISNLTACSSLNSVEDTNYPKSRETRELEDRASVFGKELSWKKQ